MLQCNQSKLVHQSKKAILHPSTTNTQTTVATCLKKLEMVMVTGRNESRALLTSSAFQLSRLSGVPLFGRSIDDFRKLSYGEKAEPVEDRFRSTQNQLHQIRLHHETTVSVLHS